MFHYKLNGLFHKIIFVNLIKMIKNDKNDKKIISVDLIKSFPLSFLLI